MIVQRLWDKRCDWDDPQLPEDLLQSWTSWARELQDLPTISKMSLPRFSSSPEMDRPVRETFIIFVMPMGQLPTCGMKTLKVVKVAFLVARSRVAP